MRPPEADAFEVAATTEPRQNAPHERRRRSSVAERTHWNDAAYVFVERPRCPACGGVKFTTHRTITGAESVERLTECAAENCRHKFRLVLE